MIQAFLRTLLLLSILIPFYSCQANGVEKYQAGENKDYEILVTPVRTNDPTKIEVVEVFWYGCIHCFHLEPSLEPWVASLPQDVDFERIPTTFGDDTRALHAKMYYTAKQLNKLDAMHSAIFKAMNIDHARFASKEEIATFFSTFGVDEKHFSGTFDSFIVDSQTRQGENKVAKDYGITGTPTIIVNGKYRVMGAPEKMLAVTNFLIEKERVAMKAAKK